MTSVRPLVPFHAAVFVADLGESSLGAVSHWNPRFESPTLPLHAQQGHEPLRIEARRVRTDPGLPFNVTVERGFDVELIRPNRGNRWHHVGFWSQDLEDDAGRLEQHGYVRDAWSQDDEGRLVTFVYLLSPQGLRVELTQDAHEAWTEWWHREHAAGVAEDVANGLPAADVQGPLLHHIGAVLDDPEKEAHALQRAIGLQWQRPVEAEATVIDGDVERNVTTRVITSASTPPFVFVWRSRRDDRFPGSEDGWDHVAFGSSHLDEDVAALEKQGYRRTVCWMRGFLGRKRAVLLTAPEGTRIMLVANEGCGDPERV
jgi:hypothetical protein